jgi:hypothetical protein
VCLAELALLSSSGGAGVPGCDEYPWGKSRSGEIRIVTICPDSNLARFGPKKPISARKYFLGICSIISSWTALSSMSSALPMNAGPVREPIQTITGLPRWIRLAFQLFGLVSIKISLRRLVMNHTGAAVL